MNEFFVYNFKETTAVITGAARGLGYEFARALAKHGATVFIGDVDDAAGANAEAAFRAEGLDVHYVHLDVTQPQDSEMVSQMVFQRCGRLDIWVNNAGIARHGASATYDPGLWNLSINIMLSGTFFGAQAAARVMLAQRSGSIINIASVNGFVAQAGRASYCAAKAGVIRLTEVLASEWAPEHVRVNAIAPAVFMTDLARASIQDGSSSLEVYLNRSPTHRLGELDELTGTLLFLVSEHSAAITGQTLRVDGGWVSDQYL